MKKYFEDTGIDARIQEIEAKVDRLKVSMQKFGLEAIAINKSNNFAWITAGADNIVTRYSEGGVATALITVTGERYILLNIIEEARFIEEEQIEALGFKVLSQPWYEDYTNKYIEDITEGKEIGSDYGLFGSQDANSIIADCQLSLLENEIGRYLYLGKTFSKALEQALEDVRPGDTEISVVGQISQKMWEAGVEPVLFLAAGDERILDYRHCIPTDNRIRERLMVSVNARYKGLVTKLTRFVNFGKPNDEFVRQYKDTLDIENGLIEATTVGTDDLDIFRLSQSLYAEKGYPDMWKNHHQGGPQGYTNGYYLITENTHGIVRENQCYCYNPSITGSKTEDGFIVTEDGPLLITYPVSFPVEKAQIGETEILRPGVLVL